MGLKDIPLSNTFKDIQLIKKGMSGDKKYYITTNKDEHLLLRISDISEFKRKEVEYGLIRQFFALNIPMPQPIDFGVCNNNTEVYTLLSWINGEETEIIVPQLPINEQYNIGKDSGEILKKIHALTPVETNKSWKERYFSVLDERLDAFRQEGDRFHGYKIMLEYIENNRCLLDNRPQTYHHGDYHMGNLILSKDKKLSVIDWHTVDFENIGDPWYEFNRIGIEYPYFASGQIDGYFNGNVPNDFWLLLAYYLSVSSITSIVWAKYFAPDRLSSILNLNMDILKWFSNMKCAIPTWYTQTK